MPLRTVLAMLALALLAVCSAASGEAKPKKVDEKALSEALAKFLSSPIDTRDTWMEEVIETGADFDLIKKTAASLPGREKAAGFKPQNLKVGGTDYKYYTSLPQGYNSNKSWPMIVCLTWGPGGEAEARTMMDFLWKENAKDFIVLQLLTADGKLFFDGSGPIIEPAIRWALTKYNVDRERIYLTGSSNGGIGSGWFALRRADMLAHMMVFPGLVLKGQGVMSEREPALKNLINLPILLWAGEKDTSWAEGAKAFAAAMEKIGNKPELIISPGEEHLPSRTFPFRAKLMQGFLKEKLTRPAKFEWTFIDTAFPIAHGIELTGDLPSGAVSVEKAPGKVVIGENLDEPIRLYLTDADLDGGKVQVLIGEKEVWNGAPSTELKGRLYALYAGFTGGEYTWSVEVRP